MATAQHDKLTIEIGSINTASIVGEVEFSSVMFLETEMRTTVEGRLDLTVAFSAGLATIK